MGAKQVGVFTADIFGLEKLMRTIPLNTQGLPSVLKISEFAPSRFHPRTHDGPARVAQHFLG
jgi:hypothetical protein